MPETHHARDETGPATPLVPVARQRRAGSAARLWLAGFAVSWLAMAAWSFASPMGSGPDEPAHLIRAASLVRGQLLGTPLPHPSAMARSTVTVTVPQVFAHLANDVGCFQFKASVPASCQAPLGGSGHDVSVYTYVGRYPPLYYAFVGLPTLAFVNPVGMYGARLVSAALSAAMLGLALVSVRRCRGSPLLPAGLAIAVTPMALYLGGVVNPSGLEISSAISAWVAAMALVHEARSGTRAESLNAFGTSLVVLLLVRGLSPLWAALIVLALVTLLGRKVGALAVLPAVRRWSIGVLAVLVAAGAWDVFADPFLTEPGSPVPPGSSTSQVFVLALERLDLLVTSTIGFFGWLDTPSPFGVTVAWLAALGAVLALGVCLAQRRDAAVAGAVPAAWVVVPLLMILSQARSEGILGQGRDFMALGVGAPIVAAAVAGQRFGDAGGAALRRFLLLVVAGLGAAQVTDFYGALRRNTVGANGTLNAFATGAAAWRPPVPALVLFLLFALGLGALSFVLCGVLRAPVPDEVQEEWKAQLPT